MSRTRANVQAFGRYMSALVLGCALLPTVGKAADTEAHTGVPQSSPTTATTPESPTKLPPLIVVDGHTLLEGQAELSWAGTAAFTTAGSLKPKASGHHAYRTKVELGRLPEALREKIDFIQRTGLDLYDGDGNRCQGQLAPPQLHLELDADTPAPKSGKLTLTEIPARSQLWLVAHIDRAGNDCATASWAWPSGPRAPQIWQRQNRTSTGQARIARVRRIFLKSEAHAELKQAFLAQQIAEPSKLEKNWQRAISRGLRFEYWRAPIGDEGLVFMHFEGPTPIDGTGWVVQINREGQQIIDAPMRPIAVFDADGDGIVEILEQDDHGRWLFEGSPDLLNGWSFVGPDDLDGC